MYRTPDTLYTDFCTKYTVKDNHDVLCKAKHLHFMRDWKELLFRVFVDND